MSKEFLRDFPNRLKSLLNEGEKKQAFAARIGIHPVTLSDILKNEALSTDTAIKICDATGCLLDWLVKGKGDKYPVYKEEELERADGRPPIPSRGPSSPLPASGPYIIDRGSGSGPELVEDSDLPVDLYVRVPLADGQVAAGLNGALVFDSTLSHYPFRREWVEHKFGRGESRIKSLVLVRVAGDSMHPTISAHELILVDTWEPERLRLKAGAIYLVRLPEGTITLKRASVTWAKKEAELHPRLLLYSDNPSYPPFEFNLDPDRALTSYILGRVRWAGKEFD